MPIPPEIFLLPPNSTATLQQQVQQIVAEAIVSGRCLPGEKMPSSRKLAEHLGVARITVTVSYTELVADEYLVARPRSGYYVADTAPTRPRFDSPAPVDRRGVDWAAKLTRPVQQRGDILRPPNWSDYRFPFIYGQSDPALFDHANWRACALRAVRKRDFDSLAQDRYQHDDPMLVEFILRHILPRRGIHATPDQILITMGGQNALWMIAQLLLADGQIAIVENPCFPGLRRIFDQMGYVGRSIDVDHQGLPPDLIPPEAQLVFTTPSHHAPTNVTMPLERRIEMLARAARHDFLIVEDDYEFEMSFRSRPSPALKSLDQDGRVIYLGSFSKSIFPGLRLGYVVGDQTLIEEMRKLRTVVLRHPPSHIQRTTAYFLSLGHYDAQVARMARHYGQRRAIMEEGIRDHGLTREQGEVLGGSSFWMRAPPGVDTTQLALDLRRDSVLIEPGSAFFARRAPDRSHYRIAYSSIAAPRIAEGMALLAGAIDRAAEGAGAAR
ncbi:PLP-dependent aminotransferase family protein [Poseidonocella sedimentorum]|uniref:Transcriptional regulator, GntR family n=1 Tax=Poseidonocella sedimentorum TaxID=871652 RepID=A0A1I6EA80_9RHOB|nr:PLP-dependent aminotransferase family protein [Poseidonocella sedimentorum]SFR14649.1 transcriptional regulator, GntR family [Poseidonocella sedimentorum]